MIFGRDDFRGCDDFRECDDFRGCDVRPGQGLWIKDYARTAGDVGLWIMDYGASAADFGLWIMDYAPCLVCSRLRITEAHNP